MSAQELLTEIFEKAYKKRPSLIKHAPGRVNLIGDHTDYNEGFVLPAAINFGTNIAATKRDDRVINVVAVNFDHTLLSFSLDDMTFDDNHMWVNYIKGSLLALLETYPDIKGADLVVTGNVPIGAGLSSSASFEIAILRTFAQLYDLPLSGVQAALKGQQAENNFVGCSCGIMDQLISALGKEGHAMLLDCRSLTYQQAPIPSGISILIVNSNVKRGLVDSEYNTRREQCEQVAAHFEKTALRDVTLNMLEARKAELEDMLYRRAKHVVTENDRTEQALKALSEKDMATISQLMAESHASMRDDFAVTTSQIDYLVEIIAEVLGEKGGTRMTGGGFGGCVVALVPTPMLNDVIANVEKKYEAETGLSPSIYTCTASKGAFA